MLATESRVFGARIRRGRQEREYLVSATRRILEWEQMTQVGVVDTLAAIPGVQVAAKAVQEYQPGLCPVLTYLKTSSSCLDELLAFHRGNNRKHRQWPSVHRADLFHSHCTIGSRTGSQTADQFLPGAERA